MIASAPIARVAAASALALLPIFAEAQTLRERQAMAASDKAYAEAAASVSEACGTEIGASIDWQDFRKEDFASNNSLHGWCSAPLDAIRGICTSTIDDGLGLEAVRASIGSVVCQRGDERSMSLSEGELRYTVTFESSNDYYFANDWLLDNL